MKPLPVERRPGECVDCFALPWKPDSLSPGEEHLYPGPYRPVVARPTDGAPRKPRCATHRRALRKLARVARHDTYVVTTYGVSPGFYAAMYAAQGGRCAICRRATGKSKRLAVDHDHRLTGAASVRGLLCTTCNHVVIGRYDVDALRRAIEYLLYPPAQRVLVGMDEVEETG